MSGESTMPSGDIVDTTILKRIALVTHSSIEPIDRTSYPRMAGAELTKCASLDDLPWNAPLRNSCHP